MIYCCCSVAKSCPTLCDPMDCSTPGFPVHHHLPELAQTYVHWYPAFPDAGLHAGDTAVSEADCPCPPGDYSLAE